MIEDIDDNQGICNRYLIKWKIWRCSRHKEEPEQKQQPQQLIHSQPLED